VSIYFQEAGKLDGSWLTEYSVNMYASTWICTKETNIQHVDVKGNLMKSSMGDLMIGEPAVDF
jgi:hypothetical protein